MNEHLKYYYKSHCPSDVRLADLRAVLAARLADPHGYAPKRHRREAASGIRARIEKRGGKCTHDEAFRRFDRAADALGVYDDQANLRAARRSARGKTERRAARRRNLEWRKRHQLRRLTARYWPGGDYSGDTDWELHTTDGTGSAHTTVRGGEQYSRRCRYQKTNATHRITLNLAHVAAARRCGWTTIDGAMVSAAKELRPGIWSVTLLATSGKRAIAIERFAARQTDGRVHLAKTERGAVVALGRDARAKAEERLARISGAVCRRWGWCGNGVRQWCNRHGIHRNVAQRIRGGATAIALARLIQKHGGAETSYDRRIVCASGD